MALTVVLSPTIPSETSTVPGSLRAGLGITFPTITVADSVPGPAAVSKSTGVGLPIETDAIPGPIVVSRSLSVGIATETDFAIGPPIHADGLVTMTMSIAATGHVSIYHANGLVTLSASVAASGSTVPSWAGTVALLPMSSTGELLNGTVLDAALTLPAITSDGDANSGASIALPALTISATMVNGKAMSGFINMPVLSMTGTLSVPHVYDYAQTMPALRAAGTMLTGAVLNASLTMQSLQASGSLAVPEVFTSAITLPAMSATGELLVTGVMSCDVSTPALVATGTMTNAVALVVNSIAVNTKHFAHTKYSSFAFNSFGQLNGSVYGADSTGLYRLDGSDDTGTPIAASFVSGADDYNSARLKAQNVVYLGYESDGDVELLIGVDDDPNFTYSYPVDRDLGSSGVRPARVSIGRGLRSRYWHTGVRNVNGAYFKVYELSHGVSKLKRKS